MKVGADEDPTPDSRGEDVPKSQAEERWGRAAVTAALLVGAAVLGFGVIPDRLVEVLTPRVSARVRDALLLVWVTAFFVVLARAFTLLQRKRGR